MEAGRGKWEGSSRKLEGPAEVTWRSIRDWERLPASGEGQLESAAGWGAVRAAYGRLGAAYGGVAARLRWGPGSAAGGGDTGRVAARLRRGPGSAAGGGDTGGVAARLRRGPGSAAGGGDTGGVAASRGSAAGSGDTGEGAASRGLLLEAATPAKGQLPEDPLVADLIALAGWSEDSSRVDLAAHSGTTGSPIVAKVKCYLAARKSLKREVQAPNYVSWS
ncbi:circumsporozoite protein-like [Scylla paramamosain]|uniref:circumsporozoite protein-like n=1 Tax=Scylla paramamosain TaxID=85552 RepID=UPI0030834E57